VHGSALAFLILAYLAAMGVALWTGVPPQTLLTWGAGGAALLWLIVLVTLPWNLHFRAREVLGELRRSRAAGILVTDEVLDSPRAIHIDEAENRLHVQKALLHALLTGEL